MVILVHCRRNRGKRYAGYAFFGLDGAGFTGLADFVGAWRPVKLGNFGINLRPHGATVTIPPS